ncbi:MAG: acyl-CoA/acyl-ACP dehydrogenase [Hyphomicrobiaceae bacterium]|nr:acyl-CoA/acyl-ACP dehydrogenase [Hyphomicrobiaceae bacterium]
MDFTLSEEQAMMVDAAKRMVETRIEPVLKANPADRALPKSEVLKIMQAAADLGIPGARIPEDAGGTAMRALDYGLIHEHIPANLALMLQPHEATTMRFYYGCNEEQRERFLPDLLSCQRICCSAITEPDVGSNPREVTTRVVEDGDWLVLTGRKMWISNAPVCDVMNVTCRDSAGKVVRVLVDRQESPFQTREIQTIGLRQSHLGEVVFNDVRVPRQNLCGEDGDAQKIHTLAWNTNRPLIGLTAVNLAQKALDAAREYAGIRKQFGRPLGAFQLIQNDLAEMETLITASRLVCYNALAALDRGERTNGLAAMAKRYAVDSCDRAIALAMRIHGAMGLSTELGLEQLARDVRMLTIPDGAPSILALIQGRELTGIAAFRG